MISFHVDKYFFDISPNCLDLNVAQRHRERSRGHSQYAWIFFQLRLYSSTALVAAW